MSIQKTIGGDRLGSGNKMKVRLHNYERSTHNLSRVWRSSMAPGTLVPFLVEPALNGDTFEIDLEAKIKTLPTIAPLFGSFKLQLDVFECPIRLYQAMLHNNALDVGMNMKNVLLPQMRIQAMPEIVDNAVAEPGQTENPDFNISQFSPDSLITYLGLRGPGYPVHGNTKPSAIQVNAIPLLAYWDIFKNYYANKQEENAYYIGAESNNPYAAAIEITNPKENETAPYNNRRLGGSGITNPTAGEIGNQNVVGGVTTRYNNPNSDQGWTLANPITIKKADGQRWITIFTTEGVKAEDITLAFTIDSMSRSVPITDVSLDPVQIKQNTNRRTGPNSVPNSNTAFMVTTNLSGVTTWETMVILGINIKSTAENSQATVVLKPFPLKNIDTMRECILKTYGAGERLVIQSGQEDDITDVSNPVLFPYSAVTSQTTGLGRTNNYYSQNGLAVKTYQSDKFNNWINTDWIDGENGISAITAISTTDGSFTIDALNLAQKVYNMLNRIAVSGGTYDDWQEAVYGQNAIRRAESPIYCGGMSGEIVFEEIVSSAETDTDESGNMPLGTLGGKGTMVGKKGGRVRINVREPSFIIGIASITPRIDYSQGNKWWMTELESMDDLHKPALDGIGFQELLTSQMAWWDMVNNQGVLIQSSAGKQPAWLDYMTSYNEVYGDFANKYKAGYMVLTRDYEPVSEQGKVTIKDLTTYIDPTKFNYAFAQTDITAQNFWIQIGCDIKARRKMSAKQIPNL